MSEIYKMIYNKIMPIIEQNKCSHICDYGCGRGELLDIFKSEQPGLQLTGIDYFDKFTEENPRNRKNEIISFIDRNGDDFHQLQNMEKFDFIISTFALHHYQYPVTELQTIAGMLKPGGILFIIDHNFSTSSKAEITKAISSFIGETFSAIKKCYHRHHYTLDEVKDLLHSFTHELIFAEVIKADLPESEMEEDKNSYLKRNKEIQEAINKNAPDYWKSIRLPFYQIEENLLTEYGIDFSSVLLVCVKKV